jgi:hypothetical protein
MHRLRQQFLPVHELQNIVPAIQLCVVALGLAKIVAPTDSATTRELPSCVAPSASTVELYVFHPSPSSTPFVETVPNICEACSLVGRKRLHLHTAVRYEKFSFLTDHTPEQLAPQSVHLPCIRHRDLARSILKGLV